MERQFDLNIEKILDNWENYHAVREIIANALDEMILTNTQMITVDKVLMAFGIFEILDVVYNTNTLHKMKVWKKKNIRLL